MMLVSTIIPRFLSSNIFHALFILLLLLFNLKLLNLKIPKDSLLISQNGKLYLFPC